ncbi:MAG: hypothetical protein HQ492_03730, partial [Woeseiaceae bacterium]|nr:hypothetical protein [Woeseiaceae bacterium]
MSNDKSKSIGSKPVLVPRQIVSGEGNALTQDEKHLGKTLKKSIQLSSEDLVEINT